jgi:hypothetical protein
MKKLILLSAIFSFSCITAQIKTPQPSPSATIVQKVGISNVTVDYSRPGVKKREVFGGLVAYNKIWRTGANKATKITFDENFFFGGAKVKKGSYSLFTIPGEKEWYVLLNKETELWGSGNYNDDNEVVRIAIAPQETKDFTESFTIEFGNFNSFSAVLSLKWANTLINIDIESMSAKKVQNDFLELLTNGPSANDYYNGAKFFVDNTSEEEMALEWINIAIEKKPDAFWMMYHKARILKKMGNNKEAVITAQETISMASEAKDDYGYTLRCKNLIKEIKSK